MDNKDGNENKNKKMSVWGLIYCLLFLGCFTLSCLDGALHGKEYYSIKTHSMVSEASAKAGGVMGVLFGTLGIVLVIVLFIYGKKKKD